MICDCCGKKGARIRRKTRTYGTGKTAFLIENVPVVSCRSCGESYVTAKTLKELDRIRQERRTLAVKRLVSVARFGGVA